MNNPRGGQKIPDFSTFKERVGPCSHIAVYRPFLEIYHHYLVKEIYINYMVIYHNVGGLSKSLASFGFAEIKEETIKFATEKTNLNQLKSDHLDFDSGLYLIERTGYPSTQDEKKTVIERAKKRLGEKDYTFSSSNCEWFVTWAITGVGECEQIKNAGRVKRIAADFADSTVCNYRSAGVRTLIDKGLQGTIRISFASGVIKISLIINGGTIRSSIRIHLDSTTRSNFVTGAVAAMVAAPLEAFSCIRAIYSLHNKKTDKIIDERTFKREVTKKVFGSVASVGGNVGGTLIGQMLIPIPIVGGIVGGIVGSLIGRTSGSVISGTLFDLRDEELRNCKMISVCNEK